MSLDLRLIIIFMEFASSIISFLVGYYALKGYKASGARGLLLLCLGFLILGLGIFLRVLSAVYFVIVLQIGEASQVGLPRLFNLTVWIYTVTQLIAYGLFAVTYVLEAKNLGKRSVESGAVAAVVSLQFLRLFYIPQLELVAIVLLGFTAAYSFMNWVLNKGSGAALVFLGFAFLFLSHLFFFFIILNELLLLLGQITQLVGFVCLAAMLAQVSRRG